jgi:GNAT superfamily N-acetyltransferase
MPGEIVLRAAVLPADEPFLRAVYNGTRDDLTAAGLPPGQLDGLLRMQFDAQARHYGAMYPSASQTLIVVDGEPAGRMIVDRAANAIRIVDIALLPHFRSAGTGSRLVEELIDEATTARLPLRCHVEQGNADGRRFWERHGLRATGLDGAHIAMERRC